MDFIRPAKAAPAVFAKALTLCRNARSTLSVSLTLFLLMTASVWAVASEGARFFNHGSASINADYEITLDTESALEHIYEADISHLNLSDEEAAKALFSKLNSPSCTISVRWMSKKIEIIIQPDPIHAEWSVADWNTHLKEKAKALSQN